MTADPGVHRLPITVSLRACAARALVELADRAGARPPDVETLAKAHAVPRGPAVPELRATLAALERPATPQDMALLVLAGVAQLDGVELLAVTLLVAVEEDPAFVRAIVALQAPAPGARPTLGLVAAACAPIVDSMATALHALLAGHARATGILRVHDTDRPAAEQTCSVAAAIHLAVCDRDAVIAGASVLDDPIALPASIARECERLGGALRDRDRALVVRTTSTSEGRAVCAAIARARELRAVFLDGAAEPALGPYLGLRGLLPVFVVELGPGERRKVPVPPGYDGPVLVLTGRDGNAEVDGVTAASWNVPVPAGGERQTLWREQLGDSALARALGVDHRHGVGRIAQLARSARRLADLERAPLDRRHVRAAAWISEGAGIGGLAEPILDEIPDDAMVTTPALRRDLELLLARCQAREGLGAELGAAIRSRLRPGVRSMFIGPSGTGKTLAASWLATRLGLPLYRVDLAAVTSKYIGETEKNLAQLLARAEHEELVLLFDEADSMFGKRTDVKEANDRFANAQTNFLLQRIESFDGIVVLTSNSRSRLDPAFTRRLDAVIEFPIPGPEERRALWLAHLGSAHELDAAAINKLAATVDLVGGHIRNAVLSAAVLARRAGGRIAFAHLVDGLVVEYRKLGRSVPPELQREG